MDIKFGDFHFSRDDLKKVVPATEAYVDSDIPGVFIREIATRKIIKFIPPTPPQA